MELELNIFTFKIGVIFSEKEMIFLEEVFSEYLKSKDVVENMRDFVEVEFKRLDITTTSGVTVLNIEKFKGKEIYQSESRIELTTTFERKFEYYLYEAAMLLRFLNELIPKTEREFLYKIELIKKIEREVGQTVSYKVLNAIDVAAAK